MATPPTPTPAPVPAPAAKTPPAALYRLMNPVMAALLRSPLHRAVSGRLMLLEFAGRRSGRRYAFPVGYVEDGGELLVGSEKGWVANFRGGQPVSVRLRGERRRGTADPIEEPAALAAAYRRIAAVQPGFFRFVGVRLEAAGTPNPADVARAAAAGHRVVRVRLDPAPAQRSGAKS